MTVVCNQVINTRALHWDPHSRWFVGGASELPPPGQVWAEDYDVGYRLVSHRTGHEVVFCLANVRRDADGDIQVWIYRPVDTDVSMELHVLND